MIGDNYNKLAPTAYTTKGKLAVLTPAVGKSLKFSEIAIGSSVASAIRGAIMEQFHNDAWKAGQYNATADDATAVLNLTNDITLTSEVEGAVRNGTTFTIQVAAAAANDDDELLFVFSGTPANIVVTVTPNDGTNNPVGIAELEVQDLTYTAQEAGEDGNDITIAYIEPVSGTNPLSVDVTGTDIVVNLESTAVVAAVGTLDLTADIVLTSVAAGAARNTDTFTLEVAAAAANPTNTILADFTGTADAIICTITPNDGTNNGATPVDLTTAELVELINTGAVVGKTVTITDASAFRNDQTATGGGATVLVNAGEGDGVVATFADGADFVASVSTADEILAAIEADAPADALVSVAVTGTGSDVQVAAAEDNLAGGTNPAIDVTTAELAELIDTGLIASKNPIITDSLSLRELQTAIGGGAAPLAEAGEGDGVSATFSGGTAAAYTDDTTDAQDAGTGDFPLFSLVNNDGYAIQAFYQFNFVAITVSTAEAGSPVFSLQYWNGSTYATLNTIEAPASYSSGLQLIVFHAPIDWAKGGPTDEGYDERMYHIRVRATTAPSTNPLATDIVVARFVDYNEVIDTGEIISIDYEHAPMRFLGGNALMAYFSTADNDNFIEASYREV